MSDFQVQTPHDFENSKNELKKFSENLPSPPTFGKLQTKGTSIIGSLFGTDHNVTGREVNSKLIVPMQKEFNSIHKVQEDIVKEFGVVFNTFEKLDKEYIGGLNKNIEKNHALSIKAQELSEGAQKMSAEAKRIGEESKKIAAKALEATEKAEKAQEDIKKTITALKQTLDKLSNFEADLQDVKKSAFIQFSIMKDETSNIIANAEKKLKDSQELLDKSQSLFRDVNDQKVEVAKLKLKFEKKTNQGLVGLVFAFISTILVVLHIFNVL